MGSMTFPPSNSVVRHNELMEDTRSIREMVRKSIQEATQSRERSRQDMEKVRAELTKARMAAEKVCDPFRL